MRTQTTKSGGIWPLVLAAALVVGGFGGYELRRIGNEGSQAAAAAHNGEAVVPRAVREGVEITPFQAPAPRWTHEDDVIGSATK